MDNYNELFVATTDTVPGLGAPLSEQNKALIYKIKNRPLEKPLVIMVGSIQQAKTLKGWTKNAEKMALQVWPGAVTLVLDKELSVRMPNNNQLCEFILKTGPIYMSSANKSGDEPYSLEKAKKVFKEIKNFYDFGKGSGKPSTIIDVETGKVYR